MVVRAPPGPLNLEEKENVMRQRLMQSFGCNCRGGALFGLCDVDECGGGHGGAGAKQGVKLNVTLNVTL